MRAGGVGFGSWSTGPAPITGPVGVATVAAKAEGLEWVWVSDKAFADDDEALVSAIRAQSNRRNLEPGELLRCIARLDAIKQRGERTDLAQDCAKSTKGKSSEQTASMVGVSAPHASGSGYHGFRSMTA